MDQGGERRTRRRDAPRFRPAGDVESQVQSRVGPRAGVRPLPRRALPRRNRRVRPVRKQVRRSARQPQDIHERRLDDVVRGDGRQSRGIRRDRVGRIPLCGRDAFARAAFGLE